MSETAIDVDRPMPQRAVGRFWSKVRRETDGCWEWQARVDRGGYGIFSVTR